MSYNRVSMQLEGRITKQGVTLKFGTGGGAIATWTTGYTPRVFNKQTNEWSDGDTQWYRCVAFGRLAELYATIPGGTLIYIIGRKKLRYWEGPDGKRRSGHELIVDHLLIPVVSEKSFFPEPDGTLVFRRRTREPAVANGIEDAAQELFDDSPF
jgi:single-stranded DNA-binding protein